MADRRSFLKLGAVFSGMVTAALAGIPAVRAFLSPVFGGRNPDRWIRLGSTFSFEPGVPVKVDFVESASDAWVETRALRSVWVFTEDNETFTVFHGRCTHLGCAFSLDTEAQQFVCPCHQGKFEPKTGQVIAGPPPRPLDRLETRIDDDVLYASYRNFRLGVAEQVAT
jgi:menaquinol-cytochrome c reductase iron-sulfur subunit